MINLMPEGGQITDEIRPEPGCECLTVDMRHSQPHSSHDRVVQSPDEHRHVPFLFKDKLLGTWEHVTLESSDGRLLPTHPTACARRLTAARASEVMCGFGPSGASRDHAPANRQSGREPTYGTSISDDGRRVASQFVRAVVEVPVVLPARPTVFARDMAGSQSKLVRYRRWCC